MKFSALTTLFLSANAVLGARFTEKRRAQHEARLAKRAGSIRLPGTDSNGFEIDSAHNETLHEQYSSNWAGAVLIGSGYKSVTGTFVVPTPKAPTGGSASTEVGFPSLPLAVWFWCRDEVLLTALWK